MLVREKRRGLEPSGGIRRPCIEGACTSCTANVVPVKTGAPSDRIQGQKAAIEAKGHAGADQERRGKDSLGGRTTPGPGRGVVKVVRKSYVSD